MLRQVRSDVKYLAIEMSAAQIPKAPTVSDMVEFMYELYVDFWYCEKHDDACAVLVEYETEGGLLLHPHVPCADPERLSAECRDPRYIGRWHVRGGERLSDSTTAFPFDRYGGGYEIEYLAQAPIVPTVHQG